MKEETIGIEELYNLQKKKKEEKEKGRIKDNVYECYFDGACTKNPGGRMGMGMVIYSPKGKKDLYKLIEADDSNSNNVAEYLAFVGILNFLEDKINKDSVINIYGDSNLVVSQMNNRWKIKAGLHDFYARHAKKLVKQLKEQVKELNIEWIPRDRNAEADKLSQQAVKSL